MTFRQGKSGLLCEAFPAFFVMRRRVDDYSIPIKDRTELHRSSEKYRPGQFAPYSSRWRKSAETGVVAVEFVPVFASMKSMSTKWPAIPNGWSRFKLKFDGMGHAWGKSVESGLPELGALHCLFALGFPILRASFANPVVLATESER
jgi:hypothetical protein